MMYSNWPERCCLRLRVCFLALEAVMWVLQSSCFIMIGWCFVPWIRSCVALHFSSNSCIAIFSRGHVELTLFWINMPARNVSSPNFLVKLTMKIGS
jgi:hypothetical protein